MQNEKTPTKGELAGAENLCKRSDKQENHTPKLAKRQQCNDCKYYRWALHKKRGTHSFCAFTGEETSPVMNACEYAEVNND